MTGDERRALLEIARAAVGGGAPPPLLTNLSGALREKGAAFVTLRIAGELRGCIGHVEAVKPLAESVREMAGAAARDDRFPPIQPGEFGTLEIEISILSPMTPIRPDEIEVGRHGLYARHGARSGLLLPQVAVEHRWSREEFLRQVLVKAGLPPGLPDLRLHAFTVERLT